MEFTITFYNAFILGGGFITGVAVAMLPILIISGIFKDTK